VLAGGLEIKFVHPHGDESSDPAPGRDRGTLSLVRTGVGARDAFVGQPPHHGTLALVLTRRGTVALVVHGVSRNESVPR